MFLVVNQIHAIRHNHLSFFLSPFVFFLCILPEFFVYMKKILGKAAPRIFFFLLLHPPHHILFHPFHNALFQSRNIRLRDAEQIRHLFLRMFFSICQAEPHTDDGFLALRQAVECPMQQLPIHIVFYRPNDAVGFCAENVRQQQFVSIPVRAQRFIKGHLGFLSGNLGAGASKSHFRCTAKHRLPIWSFSPNCMSQSL